MSIIVFISVYDKHPCNWRRRQRYYKKEFSKLKAACPGLADDLDSRGSKGAQEIGKEVSLGLHCDG